VLRTLSRIGAVSHSTPPFHPMRERVEAEPRLNRRVVNQNSCVCCKTPALPARLSDFMLLRAKQAVADRNWTSGGPGSLKCARRKREGGTRVQARCPPGKPVAGRAPAPGRRRRRRRARRTRGGAQGLNNEYALAHSERTPAIAEETWKSPPRSACRRRLASGQLAALVRRIHCCDPHPVSSRQWALKTNRIPSNAARGSVR